MWSYAGVWAAIADPEHSSKEVAEIAFRILVTAVEEASPPACLLKRGEGFWLLSLFFERLGDPVSAYTATAIEYELHRQDPSWDTPFIHQRVSDRLDQLRHAIE
jgi:hypothetical protein